MSTRKIKSELKKKGYVPTSVVFDRSCPTPSGYGSGYTIEFEEDISLEDFVFNHNRDIEYSSYLEFDDLDSVLAWVKELPELPDKDLKL